MLLYPERNSILLQILHYFKAHALPLSVMFQFSTQHFAHASATWKTLATLVPKKSRQTVTQYLEFVLTVHQAFVALIGMLPLCGLG